MTKYVIIHCKHEGCYDFQCYQDESSKTRLTSITINPPKIFLFNDKEEAQEFFSDYMNDVDVTDIRCKRGEEVIHIDYCTCGVIELDEEENPILFYNKKNQIFLKTKTNFKQIRKIEKKTNKRKRRIKNTKNRKIKKT